MRLTESVEDYPLSRSPDLNSTSAIAGPSSSNGLAVSGPSTSKAHYSNGKSHLSGTVSNGLLNGGGSGSVSSGGGPSSNGVPVLKHGKSPVARVNLPGDLLYEEANVSREEFVRLLLQGLRDVGYMESAATLEAESGYVMEESGVRDFRDYVLEGSWSKAETALLRMGVLNEHEMMNVKLLISKQKYLELLEAKKTHLALQVLRNEITPYSDDDTDLLHNLTSLIMCSNPEDVRQRAGWDGASGSSRQHLLNDLQRHIPPSVMIPQRRFLSLLEQAHLYQLQRCIYHNLPASLTPFSLYSDHQCDKVGFPQTTTNILTGHGDEVWNIEWSHDGTLLATASKDKSAIVWRVKENGEWEEFITFREHLYPVGCLAWSLDDSRLLTSSENVIKIWAIKTGICLRTLDEHSDTVTALAWLPDGNGFLSASLDRKIIHWDSSGANSTSWGPTALRVTGLAITPDLTRVITIGMNPIQYDAQSRSSTNSNNGRGGNNGNSTGVLPNVVNPLPGKTDNKMVVYKFPSREIESSIRLDGELTSVKVSDDSNFVLINHAPDEIHLWDIQKQRTARKFTGQKQGRHVIRSCFGGTDGHFVVSGSEDGNVYVWHRDTGTLLETLPGHGEGSVNSVAWNPVNGRMFASCSDDQTVRIWEASPYQLDSAYYTSSPGHHLPSSSSVTNGKGKGKTRWDGHGLST